MENKIQQIINGINVEESLIDILKNLYKDGPINQTDLELLTYIKIYHKELFVKYENEILITMGLFYKNLCYNSFKSLIFKIYNDNIIKKYDGVFTPIQAKILQTIRKNQYFSFSSPTSTGKSFVFRRIINSFENDVVIIVPSRALINEYNILLKKLFDVKTVNILDYVDFINRKKAKRNIFIITPERAKELFSNKDKLKLDLILFDEAQLSDDYSVRGLYYDSIIRRCKNHFSQAKFVFAYPFIDNPEAMFKKNNIKYAENDYCKFKQRNVGQIFYSYKDGTFFHFGINDPIGSRTIPVDGDPVEELLKNNGTLLVYCSKKSILEKKVFDDFSKYIELCGEIKDEEALKLIERFRLLIGASKNKYGDYSSKMLDRLKHGIVIHHGSLPLSVRYIIEEFTKKGFCRICFATSTLEQGINMPFDMVWINRLDSSKPLNVKNIIGRAGRSTEEPKFDYGKIVIKETSRRDLKRLMNNETLLDSISQLDRNTETNDDYKEYKEAIKSGEFSEEYNLTKKELQRLESETLDETIKFILDGYERYININDVDDDNKNFRIEYYKKFCRIYSKYLNRELTDVEKSIVESAIKIMMWRVKGKTFNQIVFYRYSYAAKTNERNSIKSLIDKEVDTFTKKKLMESIDTMKANYLPMYQAIPNKKANPLSVTYNQLAKEVDYDCVVTDTYDYLDKLIGFRLGDAFFAAFDKYYIRTKDERAHIMCNLIKYGTNNEKEIMLLRYGFQFEDFDWLEKCVKSIDENEIVFNNIENLQDNQKERIDRYL